MLKVTVAPSVSVVKAPIDPFIVGLVNTLFVKVSDPVKVAAVPEILDGDIAAEADKFALVIDPLNSLTIALKSPLNCAAVGTVLSAKVVGKVIVAIKFILTP